MKWKRSLLPLLAIPIAMIVWVYLLVTPRESLIEESAHETNAQRLSSGETLTVIVQASEEVVAEEAVRRFELIQTELMICEDASEAQRILASLRAYLDGIPREAASRAIIDCLDDPSRDAETLIPFSIGKSGFLDGHPSLRVALLDWLGEIDPQEAGSIAKEILESSIREDEWTVSLRNYARAYPGPKNYDFIRAKTEELILESIRQENPSIASLQAFDLLVHTRAIESADLLGTLVMDRTQDGRAHAYAAYLTLDRLAILEPVATMERLAGQTGLAKARGPMVANIFARSDLRDPEQRRLVRSYLLSPTRTAEELDAFANVYPNANFAISNNLLTRTQAPIGEELALHDQAVLGIVGGWIEDPEFEPVKPYLETMYNRLRIFIDQTSK